MGSVNKVILIGNVGKDVEMKSTAQGVSIARFPLATSDVWKDRDGNKQEKTEWHNIVAWEKLAQICGEYIVKGKQVYVEGQLQTRSWDDKDGNKRYTTEIKARNVVLLGRAGDFPAGGAGGGGARRGAEMSEAPAGHEDEPQMGPPAGDDDIPF